MIVLQMGGRCLAGVLGIGDGPISLSIFTADEVGGESTPARSLKAGRC